MMVRSACQQFDFDAYHDGELDAQQAGQIAEHVRTCEACAAALASMRQLSTLLRGGDEDASGLSDMTPAEMRRLHDAVDQVLEADGYTELAPFPMLKAITAIAASLLIIGMAWMMETPQRSVMPAAAHPTMPLAAAPSWERVAVTLQVDPPLPGEGHTGLAADDANQDTDMADWVLQNLQTPGGDRPL